jgi:hypothetical protein
MFPHNSLFAFDYTLDISSLVWLRCRPTVSNALHLIHTFHCGIQYIQFHPVGPIELFKPFAFPSLSSGSDDPTAHVFLLATFNVLRTKIVDISDLSALRIWYHLAYKSPHIIAVLA